jgi:FMN reductase
MDRRPSIVGLGGTTRSNSSSERALRACLAAAGQFDARTQIFAATALDLPFYGAADCTDHPKAQRLVSALRDADAVILASPAYHGGLSGLLKNALDYVEELRADERPYLHMRAVGCIVCANGPQGIGTSLTSMRSIAHALRAWPTPLGVGINTSIVSIDEAGLCSVPEINAQITALARQVVDFAKMSAAHLEQKLCAAE